VSQRWSNGLVWFGAIALVLFVSHFAWAGNSLTFSAVRDMLVISLPFAGIYALSASGLVVVYTTTGIFNFAQGAIGMFMAYVFWQLTNTDAWGLPVWFGFLLVVLVIAPLFGVALDRLIMRHLQDKPLVVQLMVTVGLMFALIGLANMIWNQDNSHQTPAMFGSVRNKPGAVIAGVDFTWSRVVAIFLVLALVAALIRIWKDRPSMVGRILLTVGVTALFGVVVAVLWNQGATVGGIQIGSTLLSWHRFATVILAIIVAIAMRFLLFGTRLGVAMRAVVDNRELAALEGARATMVSSAAWAIGCSLAAIAGIMYAPEVTDMGTGTMAFLIISAFAAAVVGRLRSLPLTYVGAVILGIITAGYVPQFLTFSGRWTNVSAAVPTILLLIVILLLPRAPLRFGRVGGVRRIERVSTLRDTALGMALLVGIIVILGYFLSTTNINRFALGMCTALVALSLVPLTGWAGQVSLAPLAFAGIGAAAYTRLPDGRHSTHALVFVGVVAAVVVFVGLWTVLRRPLIAAVAAVVAGLGSAAAYHAFGAPGSVWMLLFAALVTAPVGALLALPAMRVQGLYLALVTLAFAFTVDAMFYAQPFAAGNGQRNVPPAHLLGWTFSTPRAFLYLVTVVFALCGLGVVALRRSAFGRRLIALRDSEAASVTVGVNVFETKVAVFSLSAAMAGFAGAFVAMNHGVFTQPANNGFDTILGIPIVLALVIGGVGFVAGALFAGLFGLTTQLIQDSWHISLWTSLVYLAPGLAVLGIIQNPSGAVVPIGEGFARLLPWRKDAKQDYEELRALNAEPEVGVLGIERPFEEEDVLLIERGLGVSNDLAGVPVAGR
jgi:branched-chain amino acid transport system permease protein